MINNSLEKKKLFRVKSVEMSKSKYTEEWYMRRSVHWQIYVTIRRDTNRNSE